MLLPWSQDDISEVSLYIYQRWKVNNYKPIHGYGNPKSPHWVGDIFYVKAFSGNTKWEKIII